MEVSTDNVLNFLDVSIIINNNRITFDWFRKPTFSGRFLSYLSQHPLSHKRGVIIGLIDRVFKLSDPVYHSRNLAVVINILLDNGYPLDFIFKVARNRLRGLVTVNSGVSTSVDCEDKSKIDKCSSLLPPQNSKKFFIIPYISNLSNKVSRVMRGLDFYTAFTVQNKLNIFIKLGKDRLHRNKRSNVVYKLSCIDCDASYVGQTGRQLLTRIKEHKANIKSPADSLSVVSSHRIKGHEFGWDSVDILDEEPNYRRRLLSEMLHISDQKNSLNVQSDTSLLDVSYTWIINKFLQR